TRPATAESPAPARRAVARGRYSRGTRTSPTGTGPGAWAGNARTHPAASPASPGSAGRRNTCPSTGSSRRRRARPRSSRCREEQASLLGGQPFRRADGAGVVVPAVDRGRQLVEVDGDPVWLALASRLVHDLGEGCQLLEQVDVLRCRERGQVQLTRDAVGRPL